MLWFDEKSISNVLKYTDIFPLLCHWDSHRMYGILKIIYNLVKSEPILMPIKFSDIFHMQFFLLRKMKYEYHTTFQFRVRSKKMNSRRHHWTIINLCTIFIKITSQKLIGIIDCRWQLTGARERFLPRGGPILRKKIYFANFQNFYYINL